MFTTVDGTKGEQYTTCTQGVKNLLPMTSYPVAYCTKKTGKINIPFIWVSPVHKPLGTHKRQAYNHIGGIICPVATMGIRSINRTSS